MTVVDSGTEARYRPPSMKALKIPQALAVVTLVGASSASLSCAPRPAPSDAQPQDGSVDGHGDSAACLMQDVPENPPFPTMLCARETDAGLQTCGAPCSDGTCSAGCRLCQSSAFSNVPGFACLPRAGSTADCPSTVCQPSDCPAGCESCESPLFCIPDETMADGATPSCVGRTCDPMNGCGPGCRAVG